MREAVANSPLLHSSLTCTLFETLVHLFDWFSSHPSISKEAFSKNLQIWHSILPEGNCSQHPIEMPTRLSNHILIQKSYSLFAPMTAYCSEASTNKVWYAQNAMNHGLRRVRFPGELSITCLLVLD